MVVIELFCVFIRFNFDPNVPLVTKTEYAYIVTRLTDQYVVLPFLLPHDQQDVRSRSNTLVGLVPLAFSSMISLGV